MSWICGMCRKHKEDCEQNVFCPRTILSKRDKLVIRQEIKGLAEDVIYYSFSEATQAMEEYAQMILLKDRTQNREVLIEKSKIL